jgi:zinc transport system substrate-binding protein
MKKKSLFSKAVCAFLLLSMMLSGCGRNIPGQISGREKGEAESRLQVVATIFPQYDFARQIAGDKADVYMLLKPGEEIHSYEPTPQDIKMIQNSGLFIYTGGENDVWVENILASLGEEDRGPHAVRLLDLVETYEEESLEGMMPEKGDHDHEHEAEEERDHVSETMTITGGHTHVHGGEPDEHVWTSPKNCVTLIQALTEEFCSADPANARIYQANGNACREAFEELDQQYLEAAAKAGRRTILFGDRFPFRYLAEELDLTCYAAFSGCSAESEPSAATIAFLIDKAAEERLPVVFQIEFSNGYIARAISEAAQVRMKKNAVKQAGGTSEDSKASMGAAASADPAAAADSAATGNPEMEIPEVKVLQLHSCHNVTRDEFDSGETCLSLMTKNLEALRTALGVPEE